MGWLKKIKRAVRAKARAMQTQQRKQARIRRLNCMALLCALSVIGCSSPPVLPATLFSYIDTSRYYQSSEEELKGAYPLIQKIHPSESQKIDLWLSQGAHIEGGAVTLCFHDNCLTTKTLAKPVMDQFGYKGVVSVITGMLGNGNLTLEDLRTFQSEQWDIVSHSKTHRYDIDNYLKAEEEILGSLEWLTEQSFTTAKLGYILPGGYYNSIILDVAKPYYYTIHSGINLTEVELTSDYIYPVHYSYSLAAKPELEIVKVILTRAKQKNLWVQLNIHEIVATGNPKQGQISLKYFKDILQAVRDYGLSVNTYSEIIGEGYTLSVSPHQTH